MTPSTAPYTVATFAERPDLADQAERIGDEAWPEFMFHDPVNGRLWDRLRANFADFQFMVLGDGDDVLALGNSIPLVWNGQPNRLPPDGYDWLFESGVAAFDARETPNALGAIQVAIHPRDRGKGLSQIAVRGMRSIAERHGFRDLIGAVRPNLKHAYPLAPIERYIRWTNEDGAPFDPWLRVHWKLGAEIIGPAPRSMRIEGTVAEWEAWTGMRFPETGTYIVPEALVPVEIDRENDVGRYIEPNVWMRHRVADN